MNKRTKGKISLFLSMAVLTSMLSLPTYATDSAVAVNMNIESYTGDVMLKKSDGKKLTVKEKLRLYSGNVLSTELKSYVIINLDDKKAVKLDEKSKVIVKKKNKKQELLVEEGNLFFNIKEKLADDEVLEIRTSTMVTGIRGTSGYVITDDKGNSTLYILDGEVTIQYEDPVTHEKREVTISGGQSAQLNNTTNENGEIISSEMLVSAILPNELPPYVALELLEDDALQERIHGDTGWLVKEIAENAKNNLQAAQDENAKREENAQNENRAAGENQGAANGNGQGGAVDPLFPDGATGNPPATPPPTTATAPPPTNPPTNPPTPPTNPPTPPTPPTPPPAPPTETVLTGAVTSAQLKAAFAADKPELVVLNSADITLSEPVTVPIGKKLELRLGTSKISGNELTVSGEMSINAAASAEISGKLTVGTGLRGRAALQSTLNIYGNITYMGISPEDVLITNKGIVNIQSGTINAGIAIGIKNETPTAAISMTGGTVKSEHIAIDNSVGTLSFTNGIIENTYSLEARDIYAVKGNIALPQGYVYSDSFCIKANNPTYLCNTLPSGYEVASHTTGFHLRPIINTVTLKGAGLTQTDLERAFKGEQIGSINAENIKTVVLDSTSFALTANAEVPANKTLVVNSTATFTINGKVGINNGATIAVVGGTVNINGEVTYKGSTFSDVLITNKGIVNIQSGAKISSGDAIGIKNATDTAAISMTGGSVKSEHIAIDNSVGTLSFTNGIIENTYSLEARDIYAVKGNIALPQGYVYSDSFCIKAKNPTYLCNTLPSGYEVASHTTGFHLRPIINTVTLKGAGLTQTDLERAFKGEQIGSINAENIKTVVLDSTSFALTANAEVPANKTLVVNSTATFTINGKVGINNGATIAVVGGTVNINGEVTYKGSTFSDVLIANKGIVNINSGTINAGVAIAVKNATDTAAISMTGGTVKSEHIAIDNSVGTLSFTNGIIENTYSLEARDIYAVKGNIALPQGYVYSDSFCIKAKNPTYLCNTLPSGYEVASHTTGFHLRPIINTVTLKGAGLTQTDLERAFKGEQIGSINAENIKTVVLDSTSFALTANAEVPANKTLVVNSTATFTINGKVGINNGATIAVVGGTVNINGEVTYKGSTFSDVLIANKGIVNINSGTINAGVAIAVKNATDTAAISMTGGTVKSEHIAIDNSVGTLSFTNGVVENTCPINERANTYAVKGNIALPQGYVYSDSFCVKANNPTYLCNALPSGYEVASHTTGFHLRPIIDTVTLKGAGLTQTDLDSAFKGEQIGSINAENIKTVVLDSTSFALTANAEVPANKTLVVNSKATFSGTTDIRLIVNGAISVNSGANITVNCLLENHGNITYTGDVFNDVVITNSGKIEMRSGTIDSGAAIGIKNATDTAAISMTGGTVKSEHIAIDNSVGTLSFTNGIIENTYSLEARDIYAVKGNIALPQGYVYSDSFCVKANNPTYLCNALPSGYEVASHTTGFHLRPIIDTVTLKGAGLTQADLERAFRGEQIGSIHTENIKTVVLDNAGFALTASTEVPANKTLVVNGKATFSGTTDIRLIVNGAISVNSGANITVNCLLENHGNITYTGDVFNDVVITNNGKIEMRSGTIDAKAAIGIQNSDASAIIAMTGGTVKSEHVAIDVTVGALQFSKGIIENTYAGADTANRFALKGNAEFAGINGTDYGVIAKREALLWDKIGEHSSFGSTPLPPDRVYLSRTTI